MKRLLIVLLLATTGCGIHIDYTPSNGQGSGRGEVPVVNIPFNLRQRNWARNPRDGSCTHATMVSLFRWQGHPKMAAWWRRHHIGGTWPELLATQLDQAGVRWAGTWDQKDVAFLEWAIKTHRGCGVAISGCHHMVALVHLDNNWAGLLDNNDITRIYWVPRETFLAEWFNSRSWALTPVYTPSPPLPVSG
jgi:hypothetical protein